MEGTERILDRLVTTCQEISKISINLKGRPEEESMLEDLRKRAVRALACARGLQICECKPQALGIDCTRF